MSPLESIGTALFLMAIVFLVLCGLFVSIRVFSFVLGFLEKVLGKKTA